MEQYITNTFGHYISVLLYNPLKALYHFNVGLKVQLPYFHFQGSNFGLLQLIQSLVLFECLNMHWKALMEENASQVELATRAGWPGQPANQHAKKPSKLGTMLIGSNSARIVCINVPVTGSYSVTRNQPGTAHITRLTRSARNSPGPAR